MNRKIVGSIVCAGVTVALGVLFYKLYFKKRPKKKKEKKEGRVFFRKHYSTVNIVR